MAGGQYAMPALACDFFDSPPYHFGTDMGLDNRDYTREFHASRDAGLSNHSMVAIIIGLNVMVYLVTNFAPPQVEDFLALKFDWFRRPWEVFTLLTSGFVHASLAQPNGLSHILFNMLALFFLGRSVEEHYGRREFLWFYLVAIVFAGLVWSLLHFLLNSPGSTIGASGGVVAVVVLFALNFPKQTLLMFGVLPMPAWLVGTLLVVIDFLSSFNTDSRTAHEAHLAGAAFAAMYFFSGIRLTALSSGLNFAWRKHRSGFRIHQPGRGDSWTALQEEADRILAKIGEEGEASLTNAERKTMKKYSEQIRARRES
jgi:membrane associated rhomboid family serine protease